MNMDIQAAAPNPGSTHSPGSTHGLTHTCAHGPIRFAGYAALFDIEDAARDRITRGAFARSLAARDRPLPLFWQHRPDQVLGIIEQAAEDDRGLRVIGRIDIAHGHAAALLARRAVSGLSFGYQARRFTRHGAGRQLSEIDLFEVSLVTHPLQHGARVHLVSPPH